MDLAERQHHLPWSRIGPYRLLCELGRGSMATVYLARVEGPGGFERLVALKMIHAHLSQEAEFVERFLNEARIAARIHHPNVISVEDVGIHEGRYFLRMDYVSGETLFHTLDRTWNQDRPISPVIGAQIIAQAARGLHAAHELADASGAPLKVIHRDLGPHNLLLGYDGVVRVMDFGIAKALDQVGNTQPGTFRGTVAFMAPEQVRGETLDRRADLFALGVVLWETTVGRRLFKHSTMTGTMARILNLEIPRPSAIRRGYPEGLERIVARALERDRERRYPNAQLLSEDLGRFLLDTGAPPEAESIQRFMRETFAERHNEREEMENEARIHDHSGRMRSVLATPKERDLVAIAAPPETQPVIDALEDTLKRHAALPRADTALDDVEAPTAASPVRARSEPSIERVRAQRLARDRGFKIRAALLVLTALAVILVMLALGLHRSPPPAAHVAMVRLSFLLSPKNARLLVDGVSQDGDLVVPLSPQEYTVEVEAEGYVSEKVVVSAEASRSIEINLRPTERKPQQKPRFHPRRKAGAHRSR